MKKTFKLENLDCANCAAKTEDKIKGIDGVISASVSFMAASLTLEADEKNFDSVVKKAKRVIKKTEPDCELIL